MHAAQISCLVMAVFLSLMSATAYTPTKKHGAIHHARVARAGSSRLDTGYNASKQSFITTWLYAQLTSIAYPTSALAADRIKRAQVPHGGVIKKRGHAARAQISPPVCMNNPAPTGPTNHPCQPGGQGGDGCMNGFAAIDGSGMTLQGGRSEFVKPSASRPFLTTSFSI